MSSIRISRRGAPGPAWACRSPRTSLKALAERSPEAMLALLLLPLILFAEGTAERVPLPKARISAILYPLVLAGVAALPAALAVLVTYVMAHA